VRETAETSVANLMNIALEANDTEAMKSDPIPRDTFNLNTLKDSPEEQT
jgi:hypothetical protein